MKVKEQIQIVTKHIAAGDERSDKIETIKEIRQLERVEDPSVEKLARRLQRCWLSMAGYRIFPPRRLQLVVCDGVRSFRIHVQGGSRGRTPNT